MAKMTKKDIENIIQHRDPFLLVDEILEVEPGKKIKGVKYVNENEYYFKGHFPGNPIMPGVLQVETIAQVGAVSVLMVPENKGKLVLFAGIDKARFRKIVRPGDALILEVRLLQERGKVVKITGTAKVNDEIAGEATIIAGIKD